MYKLCTASFDEFFIYSICYHGIHDAQLLQVQGIVQDRSGKTVATLFGKWDESMHYVNGDCSSRGKGAESLSEARLLWKRSKPPKFPTRYNLTRFDITLNELTPGLKVFKERLLLFLIWYLCSLFYLECSYVILGERSLTPVDACDVTSFLVILNQVLVTAVMNDFLIRFSYCFFLEYLVDWCMTWL